MTALEQAAVWLASRPDIILDCRLKCSMTVNSCLERQATRKKFEVPNDPNSPIAREFLACWGGPDELPCRYFSLETSKPVRRGQAITRFTAKGIERNKEFSERQRRLISGGAGKKAGLNPDAFKWRTNGRGGKWELTEAVK